MKYYKTNTDVSTSDVKANTGGITWTFPNGTSMILNGEASNTGLSAFFNIASRFSYAAAANNRVTVSFTDTNGNKQFGSINIRFGKTGVSGTQYSLNIYEKNNKQTLCFYDDSDSGTAGNDKLYLKLEFTKGEEDLSSKLLPD
jgi:hypothetical protein